MSVNGNANDVYEQPKACGSKKIFQHELMDESVEQCKSNGPFQSQNVIEEPTDTEANNISESDFCFNVNDETLDCESKPSSTEKHQQDIIPATSVAQKSEPRFIHRMVSRITNAVDKYVKSGITKAKPSSFEFDLAFKSKLEKAQSESIKNDTDTFGSSSSQVAKPTSGRNQTRKVLFDLAQNSVKLYAVKNEEVKNKTESINAENNLQNLFSPSFDHNSRTSDELQSLIGENFKLPTDIGESEEVEVDSKPLLKQIVDSSKEEMNESIRNIQQIIALYMNDPSSSSSNALSEEILEKLGGAANAEELLAILVRVMGKAYHCIFAYLKLVSTDNELTEENLNAPDKSILDLYSKPEELLSEIDILSPGESSPTNSSNQFRIQLCKETGILAQTLCFENTDFTIRYCILNNNNKIAEIVSAACTQNLSVHNNIPQLYKMQTKSISYIHQQLGKYVHDVNTVNKAMIELISHFQIGKYLLIGDPYTKKINKSMKNKLKEMNVYSGIIYQIANGLSEAMTKFRSGILKAIESCSNQEGMIPTHIKSPSDEIVPIKEAIREIQNGLMEIDSTLKMGQDLLYSFKATKEIQIKDKHVNSIKNFLEAIRQLQFGTNNDMDFGAVMMAIVTNTITLVNLSRLENMNKVEFLEQKEMHLSLMKLCRNFSYFIKYTSKLESFSSYNASKTMEGIRRFSITKNSKTFEALYSWRYVFAISEQDCPYKPTKPPVELNMKKITKDTEKAKGYVSHEKE